VTFDDSLTVVYRGGVRTQRQANRLSPERPGNSDARPVPAPSSLGATDIEDTPEFGGQICTSYILGLAKVKGVVKSLLDIDGLAGAGARLNIKTLRPRRNRDFQS
jgi:hypothetical protein